MRVLVFAAAGAVLCGLLPAAAVAAPVVPSGVGTALARMLPAPRVDGRTVRHVGHGRFVPMREGGETPSLPSPQGGGRLRPYMQGGGRTTPFLQGGGRTTPFLQGGGR